MCRASSNIPRGVNINAGELDNLNQAAIGEMRELHPSFSLAFLRGEQWGQLFSVQLLKLLGDLKHPMGPPSILYIYIYMFLVL